MAYQNANHQGGGYQNVPHAEEQQHPQMNKTAEDMTTPLSNSNHQNSTNQHQQGNNYQEQYGGQQQSFSSAYQMPSYHDYMQNGNGNGGNGNGGNGNGSNIYNSNFGNYGPNVGSVDWSQYTRRSKRNRTLVALTIGVFILFVIAHPAGQHHQQEQQQQQHASESESDAKNIDIDIDDKAGTQPKSKPNHAKGFAGDGHHNNSNAAHDNEVSVIANNHNDIDIDVDINNAEQKSKDAPAPKIAYLLTYPMSGTTYTMQLVSRTTNATLATNYGVNAYTDKNENHIPIYRPSSSVSNQESKENVPGSPFWLPSYESTTKPTHNVLTLSHCVGHCMHPCTPASYIQTEASFEEACRTIIDRDVHGTYETSITPKADISKVIHLIRDPFSNIVSRFHSYLFEENAKHAAHELPNLSPSNRNAEGFKVWCRAIDTDATLSELEQESTLIPREIKELMEQVPCHSEFYKYVSWHNHVVEMAWNEDYPSLNVFYEDYATETEQRQQAIKMSEFLDEPIVDIDKVLSESLVVRSYRDHYTVNERLNAEKLVKALALRNTWILLERYFKEEEKELQEDEEGTDGEA